MQCLAVVRKANRIMDCINRGSEPKSKDVILLLYGLILSLYKELVGANQTARCCPNHLGLCRLLLSWARPSSHSSRDDLQLSKEGNGTRGVGFLLHMFLFFASRYNAKLRNAAILWGLT